MDALHDQATVERNYPTAALFGVEGKHPHGHGDV
jgi:hypothetical protein